jgi:hypothetical protein
LLKIEKSKLEKAFQLVGISVSEKSNDIYVRSILIESNKKKKQVIFRSNNEIQETTYILKEQDGVEIIKNGIACIDSFITDIVKVMKEGELKLNITDKYLSIVQGNNRKRFSLIDPEKFPPTIKVEKLKYNPIPEHFLNILRKTSISASKLPDSPILKTYDINPAEGRIVSGDGDRVTRATNIEIEKNNSHTNPAVELVTPVLSILTNGAENEETLTIEKSFYLDEIWTCFKVKSYDKDKILISEFETKIEETDGEFPSEAFDYITRLLDKEPIFKFSIDTAQLKHVMKICSVYYTHALSENYAHQVNLHYENEKLLFRMKIPNLSDMKEYIEPDEISGEDFSIWFHVTDFDDGINIMSEKTELKFYSPEEPFLIIDKKDNENKPQLIYLQVNMDEGYKFDEGTENGDNNNS